MIVHLVRRGADCYPLRIAQRGHHAVLLLGDGVFNEPLEGLTIYSSAACARERNLAPPGTALDDAAIIELIGRAEKVVAW
jgi:hypothetical protein